MIRGTHDFENALGKWEEKPITEKTWPNLKLHFSQAQNELKKIRGPTMVQAGFHQINMIASEIRGEFSQTREELANMTAILQRNGEDQSDNPPFNTTSTFTDDSSSNIEQAMATTETSYQLEMMKLLKSMQEEISKLNRGGFTQRSNGGGTTYSTAQRSNENNGNKKGKKTQTTLLLHAAPRTNIVGHTAGVHIMVRNARRKRQVIKTTPPLRIKWEDLRGFVNDGVRQKMKHEK
jgi:hypothetical protein